MIEIDPQIISYVVAIILFGVSSFAGVQWRKAKGKLSHIRKLIDTVDDALYDDAVTESEFQAIFEILNDVIHQWGT